MSKIKWKSKTDIDKEQIEQLERQVKREKFKGKDKTKLTRKELDELLVLIATEQSYL